MILNITNEPFYKFSCMQRLAMQGKRMVHHPVNDIDEFEKVFENLTNVTAVIVNPSEFILVNDILNYVSCEVVTLGIVSYVDTDEVKFLEYDAYDY